MDLKKPRFRQKFGCLPRWVLLSCFFTRISGANYISDFKRNCYDYGANLNYLVKLSDVILSGTVERLNFEENDYSEFADVRVWRIFKGIDRTDLTRRDIYRRYRSTRDRPLIIVYGLRNPDICDSYARVGDTKIFLLSQSGEREFRLNSSLLAPTLENLDTIDASVTGYPYKGRKPIKKKPCEILQCGFGGVCRVNRTSGEAYCKGSFCRSDCDSHAFAPVCGSDNVTYSNECFLQAAACSQQQRIRIKFTDSCDKANPCDSMKCQFGAKCQVSIDGKAASCMCPSRCDTYGDNDGSKPVCGDDAKDYDNTCLLQKKACESNREIRVLYHGRCDPCGLVNCADRTVCVLGPNRKPECRCSEQCPLVFDPVCGSDGQTYQNECFMRVEGCRKRIQDDLRVVFRGTCESGENPCSGQKCYFGKECYIDIYNKSSCKCLLNCDPIMRPVCGKDGVTYDNECLLKKVSCQKELRNAVEHTGPCGEGACVNYACPLGAVCVLRDKRPSCECPSCSSELTPVCGSNGISYPNECKLQQEMCQRKTRIIVQYTGWCNGCEGRACDYYARCVSDGRGNGVCRCPEPEECEESLETSVCGTDGLTYRSECLLKVAACKRSMFIVVASKGACDSCAQVNCPWGARCEDGRCMCPKACPRPPPNSQVCASDGNRYQSECYMEKASCTKGSFPEEVCPDTNVINVGDTTSHSFISSTSTTFLVLHILLLSPIYPLIQASYTIFADCTSETCQYAGMCLQLSPDEEPRCTCTLACDESENATLCGSDRRIHQNQCFMDLKSCQMQMEIYEKPLGFCKDTGIRHSASDPCAANKNRFLPPCSTKTWIGICRCNRLGSYSDDCDSRGQCPCRPGVGGRMCDHCLPGFWGIHLIKKDAVMGCQPCGCSAFGSQRDDCEQTTGRCVCRGGVQGMKCNSCPPNHILMADGCKSINDYSKPRNCNELKCHHGAKCGMARGVPKCICPQECLNNIPRMYLNSQVTRSTEVCASNGVTYGDLCQLKMFACRHQQDIVPVSLGPCPKTTNQKTRSTESLRETETKPPDNEIPDIHDNRVHATPPPPPPNTHAENVGVLGQKCFSDRDCRIPQSFCAVHVGKMLCLCRRGFIPAERNTLCVEFKSEDADVNSLTSPCFDRPCRNGGTCSVDSSLHQGFSCVCPPEFTGKTCEIRIQKQLYTLPKFRAESWMEFERIDAYSRVSIQIELNPEENEGLILYNGQENSDIRGDFISLALINGFLEFRYDLGDGPVILRSREELDLQLWHTVRASRRGKDGELHVDSQEVVRSPPDSPGSNKHLNVDTKMYLGHVPNHKTKVIREVGTRHGLTGCVKSLKINAKIYDLRKMVSADVLRAFQTGECGVDPCSSLPCLNGGACFKESDSAFTCRCPTTFTGVYCETPLDACVLRPCKWGGTCQPRTDGFSCICPFGRSGKTCETIYRARRHHHKVKHGKRSVLKPSKSDEIYVPEFHGNSYIQLPQLPGEVEVSFSAEIWIRPTHSNGLLLYSGLSNDFAGYNGGDFVALALVGGKPQFTYNLGSGVANISAKEELSMNEWHSIKISRHLRNGSMQINNGPLILGESPEPWDKLNLDNYPVYVGGVRNRKILPTLAGVESGFRGAIQKLLLNGMVTENLIKAAVLSSGVAKYEGPPCNENVCKNGGICVPRLNRFQCRCPANFSGKRCDKRVQADLETQRPVFFDGQTNVKYRNKVTELMHGQPENNIQIRFATNSTDGLLLWENRGMSLRGDYIALALVRGYLHFGFNLGKDPKFHHVNSKVYVADGRWHSARFWRSKRQGYLSVDGEESVPLLSSPGATELNTDGYLWLGGCDSLPQGLPESYYRGFFGCIETVRIDNKSLHLVHHSITPSRKLKFCVSPIAS